MNKNTPNNNYLPKIKKPFSVKYDCPMPEELNIKKYDILIDSDPIDNQIYLELGYDNKGEYSSAYYLSPEHAMEIGYIKSDLIDEIEFKPLRLFTQDVEDSLFGRMVISIYYKSEKLNIEKSFTILSNQIDTDTQKPLDEIIDFYKDHIKDVKVDDISYNYLQDSMITLRKKWLKYHKGKNPGGKEYIKPKEELAELARSTIAEIRKNK